jgi:malate dehydrogenase (quinone)
MKYDLVIVGGGVAGTALFYTISNYSDVERVLLLEKRPELGALNSDSRSNSQTLHFGDIESNYTDEKAAETRNASSMVLNYLGGLHQEERSLLVHKCQKMVLAVGDEELRTLDDMEKRRRSIFPNLERLGVDRLRELEPAIVKERRSGERIAALSSPDGYMVDFGGLAKSFIKNSRRSHDLDVLLTSDVMNVRRDGGVYEIFTADKSYEAESVVFSAGSYSLFFAKMMGYATDTSILSVGGNFYHTPKVLNGKVYRIERGSIPFAAVHGDPDINFPDKTRFGPTVEVKPFLEKNNIFTLKDYVSTFGVGTETLAALGKIVRKKDIFKIMASNLAYSVPVVGKELFLVKEVQKIVPSLKYSDLKKYRSGGGIRPQLVDLKMGRLILGEKRIEGPGIVFNVTPSPGATSCLRLAFQDAYKLSGFLGKNFYLDKFKEDVGSI